MDLVAKAETFVRIVEAGSYSAAGRSLGLSVPAVSRQVAALEADLGATLLVRTTRSLRLTDEGRRFHEHAVRLVREADAARASVRPAGALAGRLAVSASVTLGVELLLPKLPRFVAAHPAVELELRLEDRSADLVSEGIDVAVRAGLALPDTTSLVAQPLATFARHVVCAPSYRKRRGAPKNVAALAGHDVVLGIDAPPTLRFVEDGEPCAVTVASKLRVGTLVGIRAAAVAGLGLAVLPGFVVAGDIASGALEVVLRDAALAPVMAHALYRVEMRGAPRVDAFVAHLRKTMPRPSAAEGAARP